MVDGAAPQHSAFERGDARAKEEKEEEEEEKENNKIDMMPMSDLSERIEEAATEFIQV